VSGGLPGLRAGLEDLSILKYPTDRRKSRDHHIMGGNCLSGGTPHAMTILIGLGLAYRRLGASKAGAAGS